MALTRARKLAKARPMLKSAVRPLLSGKVEDWHGEYAYSLGLQAFIYGFPYIYNAQLRHKWVTEPANPAFVPYAAVNEFWHASHLIDASYRDGGCPSNDTLYSIAWVDVGAEPVILSHPDMGERYFTFELTGIASDNFGYVGQRATGPKAGSFAIVGPGWTGDLPADVDASLAPAPSPWILILGRTLVDDEADAATVHKLQEQYTLTPLSRWGNHDAGRTERRDVLKPAGPEQDPLGPFKTLNAMLEENAPPAHHELVLNQFAQIGIGAGLDVEAQPEAVKQGLIRAEVLGMALLKQQFLSGDWATIINGWRYPPPAIGRYGDDFLLRAADQSLAGIACNDPAEAVYLVNFTDGQNRKFEGGSRYELHFAAGGLPPANSFWSLTMYGSDLNLVANPIGRYSIRDTASGLKKDPDGGLTIYLQAETPGKEKEANWLPCPSGGEWFVILRMYLPRPEVIKAEWECPPIEQIH
ncbi:MAG TPA: DUF1254 domain-containing protein [Streptosporangiaceae bacterium]|nr:DUF1254 domain-containing protein [Streptosporangiaceae bacterium]